MFKTMWVQFWGKLGDKERKMVRVLGVAVVVFGGLLLVGQLTKPKTDPLTGQYFDAMRQAGKQLSADTQKPKP